MRSVCQLTASLKYYFYNEAVDMRKSFHGLEGIIHEEFGHYLLGDEVFVFMGKNRQTVKMLHREGDGITLYTRKLNKGLFQAPRFLHDGKSWRTRQTLWGECTDANLKTVAKRYMIEKK